MKSLGGLLFFFGAGSIGLYFAEMEFKLLIWIDNWGADIGWGIRGGMVALGAVLWLVGNSQQQEQTE